MYGLMKFEDMKTFISFLLNTTVMIMKVVYITVILCQTFLLANSIPIPNRASDSIKSIKSARKKCIQSKQETSNHFQRSRSNFNRLSHETHKAKEEVFDSIVKMENRQKYDREQMNKLLRESKKDKQIVHIYQPDSRQHSANSVMLGIRAPFKG